jgi:5-methylcytosine-specific restriction enzyme A
VHHCIPVNFDKSKELLDRNLITLCRRDHLLFGHLLSWRSFDKDIKINAKIMNDRITSRP